MLEGSATPWPAMSNAVPWSTDVRMMGKPKVTLTAFPNASSLIRNQSLIVVAGNHRVELAANGPHEGRVGRQRADDVDAVGTRGGYSRSQDLVILTAD